MKLGELFDKGEFVVTGEVGPVKGAIPRDENFVPSCVKSPQMGAYMNKYVSGITVPQEWIDEIGSVDKGDRKKKAAEMMGRFIKKHKSKFQGVHIMPLGWSDVVPDILERAEIQIKHN